ncbi:expressed protein [Phakopsora pachyrhizi]|uniref:Expressed protein n=1 Tax=Phakopsora pachyrhizi TaxID=170000 RepID=A0AAV0ART7_PHAPC|nr:expressed protein [Phakopsora pachyrhizi]
MNQLIGLSFIFGAGCMCWLRVKLGHHMPVQRQAEISSQRYKTQRRVQIGRESIWVIGYQINQTSEKDKNKKIKK